MAAIKHLQMWCKKQCEGYNDVQITNMTTSWRDGLAFCAIIHHFRPDLIKFDSLKKEDVFENNKMAFQVAEEMLGIPALLDAEDMVALRVPDRLSILTYVSQYHNYFTGRSPIGGLACIKRPAEEPGEVPALKKPTTPETKPRLPKVSPVSPAGPAAKSPLAQSKLAVGSAVDRGLSSNCAICGRSVLLVQRYLVDGRLYHRNCFRCKQCSNVLMVGAYKPGPEPGTFICINHQSQEATKPPPRPGPTVNRPVTGHINRPFPPAHATVSPGVSPATATAPPPQAAASGPETLTGARKAREAKEKFLETGTAVTSRDASAGRWSRSPLDAQRGVGPGSDPATPKAPRGTELEKDKDKARGFLLRTLNDANASRPRAKHAETPPPNLAKTPADPLPPGKLRHAPPTSSPTPQPQVNKTPQTEEAKTPARTPLSRAGSLSDGRQGKGNTLYSPSISPGASDTNESPSDWRLRLKPVQKYRSFGSIDLKKPEAVGFRSAVPSPPEQSVTVSVGGRGAHPAPVANPVPKPWPGGPGKEKEKEKEVTSPSPSSDKPDKVAQTKKKKMLLSPDPSLRAEAKEGLVSPAPGGGGGYSPALDQINEETKGKKSWIQGKKSPDRFFADMESPGTLSSTSSDQRSPQTQTRSGYIPEDEIQKELLELSNELDKLEQRGVELEPQLRSCEGDEREDDLMADWFKLIHEKQLLLRRESELVYTSKQQILEVLQSDIDRELRSLMGKAEETKTTADQDREQELMEELVKTVEDRNNIIDRLDEDRLREKEEDLMMEAMINRKDVSKDSEQTKKTKNKFSPLKWFRNKPKGKE